MDRAAFHAAHELYRRPTSLPRSDVEYLCKLSVDVLKQCTDSPTLTEYEQAQVRRAYLMTCEAMATLRAMGRVSPG